MSSKPRLDLFQSRKPARAPRPKITRSAWERHRFYVMMSWLAMRPKHWNLQFLKRAYSHVVRDHSYERYYSAASWNQEYLAGYELDVEHEDARYGVLLAFLCRYQRSGPILDAGCGTGVLASWIRAISDVTLIGVDYAEAAIESAKSRGLANCEFIVSDFRAYRPRASFSVIVFNESLYYIDDALGLMQALRAHLDHDGVFVVSLFDTLVTKRIWHMLRDSYEVLQGVRIQNEKSRRSWRVRVLMPK